MTYFKNVELASRYNISESTVRNWVKIAKEGKLDLTLSEHKGRSYVANLPSNIPIIERLVEENKKYRNSRSARTVTPRKEFYTLFSQSQIYDIVRNLEIHHEIPRQYNYFDGGADEWDKYTNKVAEDDIPHILTRTITLLSENQNFIDRRLSRYEQINVVDIGVGNALPVKELLAHLLELGKMGRYIAIDISDDMLKIAENNIKGWFGDNITFEGHQVDITSERFATLFTRDYLKKNSKEIANLVLFLGATPSNFRRPDDSFRNISESMNPNDLFIYTDKLETGDTQPEWFNYDSRPGKLALASRHRLVFDLLNIDESFFDVEMGFDPDSRQRFARARLKVALTLKFVFNDGERLVELERGDSILLWRRYLETSFDGVINQLSRTGFYVSHFSQAEDHEYIMAIAEIRRN
jgi:SAM-dependent methyltransferase